MENEFYGITGLEKKLVEYYRKNGIGGGSVEEQMAEEVIRQNEIIGIRPRKIIEYKPNRITTPNINQHARNKTIVGDKTRGLCYSLENVFYRTCVMALQAISGVCSIVEKASMNHLEKTRPDVAYLIKKGASFSEISEQYFKAQAHKFYKRA